MQLIHVRLVHTLKLLCVMFFVLLTKSIKLHVNILSLKTHASSLLCIKSPKILQGTHMFQPIRDQFRDIVIGPSAEVNVFIISTQASVFA